MSISTSMTCFRIAIPGFPTILSRLRCWIRKRSCTLLKSTSYVAAFLQPIPCVPLGMVVSKSMLPDVGGEKKQLKKQIQKLVHWCVRIPGQHQELLLDANLSLGGAWDHGGCGRCESQTKSPSWTKMLRRFPLEATIQKVTSLLNVGGVVHDYLPRFTGMVLETDGMSHRGLLGGWCLWCWPRIQRNTVHWSGNSMWKVTYHHLVVTLWQNSSTRV